MKEMSIKRVQDHFSLDLDLALDYNKDKRYGYDLADSLLIAFTTMSDLLLGQGIELEAYLLSNTQRSIQTDTIRNHS